MRRVAIVGGGFSGLAVAAQLVRRASAARIAVEVVVCERRAEVGRGIAYQDGPEVHLLNVPAGNMSLWPEQPAHLVAWCQRVGIAADADTHLPRPVYGRYLIDALAEVCAAAPEDVSVTHEHATEVVSALPRAPRGWELAIARPRGPATLVADELVLATGHRPPSDPLRLVWRGPRDRYLSAWDAPAIQQLPEGARVLLVGSGLTAIDVVLSLPHARAITAISRRGRLPLPHADAPLAAHAGPGSDTSLAALMRWFRQHLRRGADPRALVDALREPSTRIWQQWQPADVDAFLRHVRGLWEVHRHRMAPEVARTVQAARRSGQLELLAGRVAEVRADADADPPLAIDLATRAGPRTLAADYVVNCTGPGDNAAAWPAPIPQLIADGWLMRDSRSLGILTGPGGLATLAVPRDDLRVLGPACRPFAWESTAVPDLRQRAAELAASLLCADPRG